MDYLGDLQEVIMDAVFSIYLSRSFDRPWEEMLYHLRVGQLCEHDSILGSQLDILSVCVKNCMCHCFTTHSS